MFTPLIYLLNVLSHVPSPSNIELSALSAVLIMSAPFLLHLPFLLTLSLPPCCCMYPQVGRRAAEEEKERQRLHNLWLVEQVTDWPTN